MSQGTKQQETEERQRPVEDVYKGFLEEIREDPEYERLKEYIDEEELKAQIEKEFDYYESRANTRLEVDQRQLVNETPGTTNELFEVDRNISMCFLVDNLPISKNIKILEKTFRKRITSLLKIKNEQIFHVHFPVGEKKKTKGYAFFELQNLEKQKNSDRFVVTKMQTKPLVKKRPNKYIMKIYSLKDMSKYDGYDPKQHEIKRRKFCSEENLNSWLSEREGREQLLIRDKKGVTLESFDGTQQNTSVVSQFEEKYWLDDEVRWSPQGTFLVAYKMDEKSFELYGTMRGQSGGLAKLKTIKISEHLPETTSVGSQSFTFSPNESFFCVHDKRDDVMTYLIYEVRSCELVHTIRHNELQKGSLVIKWSPRDNYVACMNKGRIRVIETDTFEEVGKVSEKGVTGFEWSPLDASLVYYTQEVEEMAPPKKSAAQIEAEQMMAANDPYFDELAYERQQKQKQQLQQRNVEMVIYYISVPSFKVVKSKVYHEPYDLRLFWHPDGLFFATVVEDRQFNKDRLVNVISSIDVYRLKERGLPVDNLVIHQKVENVHWENNNGSKFVLICSTPSTEPLIIDQYRMTRYQLQNQDPGKKATKTMFLYRIEETQTRVMKRTKLSDKDATFVEWSPQGRFFVLGVITTDHRTILQVFDTVPVVEETGQITHFAATGHSWDPSGRYLLISTTRTGGSENNGFVICDLAGKQVYEKKFLMLRQVLWRRKPRASSLLSSRVIKKLHSPQNVRRFSRMEKQKAQSRKKDLEEKFRKEFDDFKRMRKERAELYRTKMKIEYIELKEHIDVTLEEKSELV